MKKNFVFAPLAVLGLLLGTTALHAQTDTRSVSASVSGALQGDTGFLTGGQVQVTGVGQGAVTLTRGNAAVNVIAGSKAAVPADTTAVGIPSSESSMITTFDFNRTVNTSGALVGIGTMIAQGESLGGVGVVGSSNANATRAGTATGASSNPVSGSSSTPTSAQGSLVGNFSTANTMQLVGTGALFAGSNALNLGERNLGASAGRTGPVSANAASIDLSTLEFAPATGSSAFNPGTDTLAPKNVVGSGAGFWMTPSLTNNTIALNAANAGNGTVNITASTGGFFGQGTTFGATAAPTFSDTGFFSRTLP